MKQKKKESKKFLIILTSIIAIISIVVVYYLVQNNKKVIEEKISLVSEQIKLENNLDIEGYTFSKPNIVLNPYEISPLSALIMFETEEKVAPKITIVGKDKQTTYSETFEKNTKHYLPILGLYADYENKIIIELDGEEKEFTIKTDKLPEDFHLPEKVFSDKTKLNDELYFFTPASPGYTCAYDINGDVRWYLTDRFAFKIDKLENGHMLLSTERLINSPYYTTGLYEIDFLGKIYTEYSLEGGYHHDYVELENGNLIVLSDDFEAGTVEDYIVELDRETGEIVKEIDLKDILIQTDSPSGNWDNYDWFHNNSSWYDEKTNSLILSGRHQDAVISIDYETEKLNWIIGDPTNWSEEYQKYFFKPVGNDFEWQWSQHAAMVLPDGNIFILDNGNNKSKIEEEYVSADKSYTRGVIYDIDTEKMEIRQVWQYGKERGSEFYSPYVSDVDYIDENHYIIHSGGIAYVDGKIVNSPAGLTDANKLVTTAVEVLNDKVIFEIELPTNTYRIEKMDLYGDTNFELSVPKRLGSLGETTIDEKYFTLTLPSEKIDEDYKAKGIEITKEVDRLVVEGTFDKDDQVTIMLAKYGTINRYNIRVAKRPYTALCIDIFTEEELENGIRAYKYINEEGLNGTYKIYVEINNKIYDIEKNVQF